MFTRDLNLADIVEAIDAGLEDRAPRRCPPPWLAWLSVALLRQRARQAWHRFIVDTRLRSSAMESGDVPGLQGWTYSFHGIGCCLSGPDGEALDVDTRDPEARVIDPYFFAWRVKSVRSVALPEVRLWRWMPSESMIVAALSDLREAGALTYPDGDHFFTLAAPLEERVHALTTAHFDDESSRVRWLRAVGDRETDDVQGAHRAWVRSRARDPAHAYGVLDAARLVLPPTDVVEVCIDVVGGPAGPGMGKALSVLRETSGSAHVDLVLGVLERLSPTEDPPYPAYEGLAYVLERNGTGARVEDLFVTFATVEKAKGFGGNPFLAGYAALALQFLPSQAMRLVRRALRSTTPMCVSEMAALLAAIHQPWCVRELVAALAEARGSSTIAEALRRCEGDLARHRAARLYVPPVHDASRGGFTFEEVQHANAAECFEGPLRAAQPLAALLRERYPPEWDG